MSSKKPVVLFGARGFSGRLTTEYLREYNVPFIAAGRNRAKIEDVMSQVPGIETGADRRSRLKSCGAERAVTSRPG